MISKSLKKQWVKALRSGKYKKGRGFLCVKPKSRLEYCCLGVLAKEIGLLKKPKYSACRYVQKKDGDHCETDLLGVKGKDGTLLLPKKVQNRLMKMNDATVWDKGRERDEYTFNDIADWIEKHIKP